MSRVAVVGHVEHITIAAIPALPGPGDIVHLPGARAFPGGGGGVAFYQVLRGADEILLYTAIGNDDGGRFIARELDATRARVFAAERAEPHTRDLVVVTPDAQRTIFVAGEPLHPRRSDPLPWELLSSCDAAYFTSQDPDALRAARAARILVVSARRREAIAASGVAADVIVGSITDPREASSRADYAVPPVAIVMTDGARGGHVETAEGIARWDPTPPPIPIVGTYGAGDSFAGALTCYLARGASVLEAAQRAAVHGAAVLAGLVPQDHQV